MLSVAAVQLNVNDDCVIFEAARFVGAAGACVSGPERVVIFTVLLLTEVLPATSFAVT